MKKLTIFKSFLGIVVLWFSALSLPACKDKCDTESMSFKSDIQPILTSNGCTATDCHNAGSSNGDLTVYSGVKGLADDNRILGSIKQESGFSAMPQGGDKLGDCEISKIEAWISQGKKDN